MSAYIILFVLVIVFGFGAFSSNTSEKRIRIFLFFCFLPMALVQCMRGINIGEDTAHYVDWFNEFYQAGWANSFSSTARDAEAGYKIINLLIASFTNNPHVLIIVMSLLILLTHFFYLKNNSRNIFISMVLFFGLNHFFTSMSSWRQYLAMGIAFWIYPNLLKKKYKTIIFLAFLAFCFHKSSVVFDIAIIGAYFISKKCRNIWFVLIAEMLTIPFVPQILNIVLEILPRYKIYFVIEGDQALGIGELRMVYIAAELFILFLVSSKKRLRTRGNIMMSIMLTLSIYISILNMFIPHIFRLGYYFDYFLLLLIPEVLPEMPRNKCIVQLGIIMASFMLFFYFLLTNAAEIVPYEIFIKM